MWKRYAQRHRVAAMSRLSGIRPGTGKVSLTSLCFRLASHIVHLLSFLPFPPPHAPTHSSTLRSWSLSGIRWFLATASRCGELVIIITLFNCDEYAAERNALPFPFTRVENSPPESYHSECEECDKLSTGYAFDLRRNTPSHRNHLCSSSVQRSPVSFNVPETAPPHSLCSTFSHLTPFPSGLLPLDENIWWVALSMTSQSRMERLLPSMRVLGPDTCLGARFPLVFCPRFHRQIAYSTLFFTIVHTTAHCGFPDG